MGQQSPRVLKGLSSVRDVVPFYRQSFDFTCGPACLIMAMRCFDPGLAPTREIEIDLWREANLVGAYATSRQGLALAGRRRGFRVRTKGNVETIELVDCLDLSLSPEDRAVAASLHEDLKARCEKAGVPDTVGPVSLKDIEVWLGAGWVPLVLVDARLVRDEALPHWVVVTACGPEAVTFHDPLGSEGNTVASVQEFQKWLGFKGTSCAVVLEGLQQS